MPARWERYEQQNDRLLADVMGRARQLSDDPLQVVLIGLTLFAERMAALPGGHPGCIVATMSYQDRLFDRGVRELVAKSVRDWNNYFQQMIDEVVAVHGAPEGVGADQLARAICCAIDGGIIMSKALGEPSVLPEQMMMVRNYIKLVFQQAHALRLARAQTALAGAA